MTVKSCWQALNMEEHEKENDFGRRGYSVLFANIWKFLALKILLCMKILTLSSFEPFPLNQTHIP